MHYAPPHISIVLTSFAQADVDLDCRQLELAEQVRPDAGVLERDMKETREGTNLRKKCDNGQ